MSEQIPNVLVVEDDSVIASAIAERLGAMNWQISVVGDGLSAFNQIKSNHFDAVILDLMLPEMNGFEIIQKVREFSKVPIIVLTARDTEDDEMHVFALGADDFLVKPLRPSALTTRVQLWIDRYQQMNSVFKTHDILNYGPVSMNVDARTVSITNSKGEISSPKLTPTEFALLFTFLSNSGMALSRQALLKKIWNWEVDESNGESTRTVDSHVKSLRKKLGIVDGIEIIQTVHGVGYTANEQLKNFN